MFRHIWTVRLCAGLLLVGTVLWLIVPQAFAASTSSDTGGWVQHFIQGQPEPSSVPDGGMQSTSDLSNLLIQPVLVAGSAPTLSAPRSDIHARQEKTSEVAVLSFVAGQQLWERAAGGAHVPTLLCSLRPQGP